MHAVKSSILYQRPLTINGVCACAEHGSTCVVLVLIIAESVERAIASLDKERQRAVKASKDGGKARSY